MKKINHSLGRNIFANLVSDNRTLLYIKNTYKLMRIQTVHLENGNLDTSPKNMCEWPYSKHM